MDRRKLIATGIGLAAAGGLPAWASDDPVYSNGPARDPWANQPPQGDNGNGDNGNQGHDQRDSYPRDDGSRDQGPRDGGPRDDTYGGGDRRDGAPGYVDNYNGPTDRPAPTFTKEELANNVSDFFGVTAENAGALVEKIFHENGRPTAYIAGIEGSGAFFFGLRYGKGIMYMKDGRKMDVFWQGPTGGFDFGGNASRVFTLCYDLEYPDAVFRRFPGVDGSAYFVGGLGVNYQKADGITLAPIRAGLGLRLGASIGYLAYSRKRNIIPL